MTQQRQQLLLAILAGCCLLPYFLLCGYAFPMADDFCFAWELQRHDSFAQAFQSVYNQWSGRYTAVALVLVNPFAQNGLAAYQLFAAANIIAGMGVFFLLARIWVERKTSALLIAVALQLCYLSQLPVLSEGIYWYNGYAVYYWSNLLFGIWLWLLHRYHHSQQVMALVAAVALTPVLVGFNELMAVIVLVVLLFIFYKSTEHRRAVLLLLLPAAMGSAFLVFAPGNAVRAAQSHAPHQLWRAVAFSQLQVLRFAAGWCTLPVAMLSLLGVVFFHQKHLERFRAIRLREWLLALYGIVFISVFLPVFFSGMLGQQRTLNFAWWLVLPLWLLTAVKVAARFSLYEKLHFCRTPHFRNVVLAFTFVLLLFTGNSARILYDFSKNNLQAYRSEMLQRFHDLQQQPYDAAQHLPAIKNRPQSIFLYDETNPLMWWQDKCTIEYFNGRK